MVKLIIGAIIGGLAIIGIVGLCFFLIKRADYINKNSPWLVVYVVAMFVLVIASLFLVFWGGSEIESASSSSSSLASFF